MTHSGSGLASVRLHVACLSLLTLVVLLCYGPNEAPLLSDRAYFTYLGQCILRGQPIYQVSFIGYPPLVPMLTAGGMQLGSWFGVPTYLSPRYVGVVVAIGSAALTLVVTRRACASPWAGWAAAATLAGNSLFGSFSVSALEPKLVALLFILITSLALQRRSWLGAGLAAGLAGLCWQPAALVALCSFAVTLWGGRREPVRAVSHFVVGMALALLPAVLYLSATDSWWDFWQRAVVIPAAYKLPNAGRNPMRWVEVLWAGFASERVFSIAAAAGLLLFSIESCRSGLRGLVSAWLGPASGGLPLFSVAWLLFCFVEFQGEPDLVPLILVQAFWTGWLVDKLMSRVRSTPFRVQNQRARIALASAISLLLTVYSVVDAFDQHLDLTLHDQLAVVGSLTRDLTEKDSIAAFHAEEVLVLDDRPSAARFLRPVAAFMNFAGLLGFDGCAGAMQALMARKPSLIVLGQGQTRRSSRCVDRFEQALLGAGYRHRQVEFGGLREPANRVTWQVYRRTDPSRR